MLDPLQKHGYLLWAVREGKRTGLRAQSPAVKQERSRTPLHAAIGSHTTGGCSDAQEAWAPLLAYRGRGRDQEFGVQPLELRPKDHSAAEGDGRGRGGACQEMAAVAVYGAKRSMRAELKQRLRALSSEERLRQSHLLTQKV